MKPEPVAGGPLPAVAQPPPNPWKWAAIILAVAIVIMAAWMLLPQPAGSPAGSAPVLTTAATPATPVQAATTPAVTTGPIVGRTPAPVTTAPGVTPTPGETPIPAPSCVPAGPPGFTVTVSPVQATASRGETVTYRMAIEAQNCFAEPIHMELVAGVLFLSQTYDLGIQDPPYPKSFEYPFQVPDTLPPGVIVNGIVRSTGGGMTRENTLSLTVQ